MAQPGKIAVELSLLMDKFNQAILESNKKLTGLGKDFDQVAARMQKTADGLRNAGTKMSMYLTLPILAIGAASVKTAADIEMLQAQLTTLLGDAEQAERMLNTIREVSASTPFETQDIATATQTLLGFNVAAEDVINVVKMIGDASQGNAEKLNSISLAYGQIMAQGKATMQDLRQLINAGVPIFQVLEQSTGKTVGQLMEMTSQGKITSDVIQQAFVNMTSEGGKFYKGMETASKTTLGTWSTLVDLAKQMADSFGQILLPTIKDIMQTIIEWLKWFTSLDEGFKKFIVAVGLAAAASGPLLTVFSKLITAYRAFFIIKAAVTAGLAGQAVAAGSSTAALIANKAAIVAVTAVTKIWNLVLMANPIGLIIGAIIALGAAIYGLTKYFQNNKTEAEKAAEAQKELKDAMEGVKEVSQEVKQEVDAYTQSLAGMNRQEQIKQLNELFQYQRNLLRKMSLEDERREKTLQRMSGIQQEIARLENEQLRQQRQEQKAASEEWLKDRRRAREKYLKYNEEFGKTEAQLEELRYERELDELKNALQRKLITREMYEKTAQNMYKEHQVKLSEIAEREERRRQQIMMGALDGVKGMVSQLGELYSMYYSNQNAVLENREREQMLRIEKEYNAEKAAIEATITDKKQRDAALEALDQKRAREERKLTEKTEKEKRKLQRESAIIQKRIAIFETLLGIPKAAFDAFRWAVKIGGPPLGAIMAAIATAFGFGKLALIQAQPLPALASGGFFSGPALIGEKGREFAFPLDSTEGLKAMDILADRLLFALQRKLEKTSTREATIETDASRDRIIKGDVYLDGNRVGEFISDGTANGQIFIHERAVI